jgi:hypothetical protein
MGGLLSIGSLACCAGTAACNAVCSVFGSCMNSTLSKLMYASILLVTLVVSCLMLAPGVQNLLTKVKTEFVSHPDINGAKFRIAPIFLALRLSAVGILVEFSVGSSADESGSDEHELLPSKLFSEKITRF